MAFSDTYIKANTVKYGHQGTIIFRKEFYSYFQKELYSEKFPTDMGEDGFRWKLDLRKIHYNQVALRLTCLNSEYSFQNFIVWCDLYIQKQQKFGGILHNICLDGVKEVTDFCSSIPGTRELSFACEITVHEISKDVLTKNPKFHSFSEVSTSQKYSIGWDLEQLLTTSQHSDVIIKCGGQEFQAHKCILSARSKVFAAMFEHDTKENQKNCVEIDNAEPDTMKGFIRFIYTDEPPANLENLAHEFHALADQYALEKLKKMAAIVLIKEISTDNVIDVLELAYLNSNENLQEEAMAFVIENFEEIVDLEEWKEMIKKYPILINEIMRRGLWHLRWKSFLSLVD